MEGSIASQAHSSLQFEDTIAQPLPIENPYFISQCRIPQCKTCKFHQLLISNEFLNNVTQRKIFISQPITCKSSKLVYLISCSKCDMQYVGKTTVSLAKRLSDHRSHLSAGTGPPLLQHHFTKVHSPGDLKILPI